MRQINHAPDDGCYQLIFVVCSASVLWASLVQPGGLIMGLITYLMALFITACCTVTPRSAFPGSKQRRCGKLH